MRIRSLNFRIVAAFSGLLGAVLLATFVLVGVANLHIARDTAAQELATGERVFKRLLEQNGNQLAQASRVLAADFGFREAVATGDTDTIVSVLENHGNRIHADLLMWSGTDGRILADTVEPGRAGQPYPFGRLLAQAGRHGGANGVERVGDRLYQLVVVPVRAPVLTGWVTMGFEIDQPVVDDLLAVSGLQVAFLGREAGGWRQFASTLEQAERDALAAGLAEAERRGQPATGTLRLDGEDFQTRLVKLGDGPAGPLYALLARSLHEAMAPFYALQGTLAAVAAIALGFSLMASTRIARRITGPLRALAQAAERIQQGDYQQRQPAAADTREIAQLAGSLAHMRDAIAEREAEIRKLAYQDRLTGLPNRLRFKQLLDAAIEAAGREGRPLTVVLLNLDRFQYINDSLGHPTGDLVLVEVGLRLRAAARAEDVVARFSGDEFALLLHDVHIDQSPQALDRLHRVFDRRLNLGGRPLDLRAGMGAAGFPEHGRDAIDLVRCADLAMHRAKRAGQRHLRYDAGMQTFREEHLSLLGDLQRAIEHDELTLHYQPKVRLADGDANAAEALVRWNHPHKGFVPPGEFIPFAEQTGYITELTRWVLAQAIRQAGLWAGAGRPVEVSVNLSARDLFDPGLAAEVASRLDRHRLPPELLCLEITESGLMEEPQRARDVLDKLRALGVRIAIDDYGTGYSSLAYLRRLPVTELKIDRAFVLELAHNPRDALIVRSTVELGRGLGLTVVAEGVEDAPTVALLAEMGCDRVQGYVFARPMAVAAFDAWRDERAGVARVVEGEAVKGEG
ncbi:putative bifunctional diguanylate cyclase/phosphodiesterase [Chitinimonas koreensis]|uniref:putative bifunctional diguanylate cyclase/phosphodiesterase n=1 Tax=Chitinimonas koreensis TaxID=356302 RepID=UPI00040817F4|nr:EAL domain-containing protein [Chitinimonas koreensis]